MSIQIQIRGGTTLEHTAFKGQSREITCDTDKKTIVVHDGQTLGGFPLARENLANVSKSAITDKGIATADADNFTPEGEDALRGIVLGDPTGTLVAAPLASIGGYLKCDGSAVSRTTFVRLFAKIGTLFGEGDGEETFNIPDYRGCFLRGLGGNSASDFATKQTDAIRNIVGASIGRFVGNDVGTDGALRTTETTNASVAGGTGALMNKYLDLDASRVVPVAVENRPVNRAVNFFIKY